MPDCGHGWSDDEDSAIVDFLAGVVRAPVRAVSAVGRGIGHAGRGLGDAMGNAQESYLQKQAEKRRQRQQARRRRLNALTDNLRQQQIDREQMRRELEVDDNDLQDIHQQRHARLLVEQQTQNKDLDKMQQSLSKIIPQLPELTFNHIQLEEDSERILKAVQEWLGDDLSQHTTTELLTAFNIIHFMVEYEGNALTPMQLLNEVVENKRRKPVPSELLTKFKLEADDILSIRDAKGVDALIKQKVHHGLGMSH